MAIKTYHWKDKEFQNMVKFVEKLQRVTHGSFKVETTFFDVGQDWYWTTIICKHPNYQMLNPKQQDLICEGDFSCFDDVVEEWFYLRQMDLETDLSILKTHKEQYERSK